MTGRIHSYETFGAVDGPGIRFIVFFQGCPLRCLYCHNPDTWDPALGTEATADEIVARVRDYRPFYRDGGVTLSGGEPLLQHEFVLELTEKLHEEGFSVAIDTAGSIPLSICRKAVDAADMLLLDIKAIEPSLAEKVTGNPVILDREKELLEYCEATGKPVWIRHVVVPGLTLDEKLLRDLGTYLRGFSCVQKIEPLPFHKLGEHKWPAGLYTLTETEVPSQSEMDLAKVCLQTTG